MRVQSATNGLGFFLEPSLTSGLEVFEVARAKFPDPNQRAACEQFFVAAKSHVDSCVSTRPVVQVFDTQSGTDWSPSIDRISQSIN